MTEQEKEVIIADLTDQLGAAIQAKWDAADKVDELRNTINKLRNTTGE